jgi:hypothetical protein
MSQRSTPIATRNRSPPHTDSHSTYSTGTVGYHTYVIFTTILVLGKYCVFTVYMITRSNHSSVTTNAHSFNPKPLLSSSPLSSFIINRNSRLDRFWRPNEQQQQQYPHTTNDYTFHYNNKSYVSIESAATPTSVNAHHKKTDQHPCQRTR